MLDVRALASGVLELVSELMLACGPALDVIGVTGRARRALQLEPGARLVDLVAPGEREPVAEALQQALNGAPWRGEVTLRGQRWVCSARGVGGLVVVRLDAPPGTLDARFGDFLDTVAEAILVHDLVDGRFVAVNAQVCSLLGYSRDELLNMRVADLDVGFTTAELEEQWRLSAGPSLTVVEARARRKDGSYVPLEVGLRRLEVPGGPVVVATARDLTDRLRKQDAVVAAREHAEREAAILDAIFEALPHAAVFADRGGIRRMNELARGASWGMASGVTGSPGEGAGGPGAGAGGDHERGVGAALQQALAGEHLSLESWVPSRGASDDTLVRTTYAPVHVGGAVIGAVAVGVDLTEQHRLRSRLALALGAARLGWWDNDLARGVITLDERCRTMLGVEASQLALVDLPGLVHPLDVPRVMRILEPDSAEGALSEMKLRIIRPADGAVRWVETHWTWAARTPGQTPTNIIGTMADVTAQHEAEQEIARLAAVVEQTPASIVITDAAGHIEYVNPAFVRVSGYGREEVRGKKPSILKSGHHPDELFRELWGEITAGRTWHGRLVNRARDGRLFTEDTIIAPVWGPGPAITHFVAVKRDITEELRMQDAFVTARRMESVGRLAGGVAHDFNNLLTVILSSVEAQEEQLACGRPPRGEDVAEIRAAAERAADLTRQLLAFARKQPVEPTVLDLNAVVAPMERLLRRVLGEDIRLEVVLDGEVWPTRADHGQLEQVLMNLVVNARDAMPEGGTLTISTHRLAAQDVASSDVEAAGNDWVLLRVRDTGVGIAPEIQPNLFEPFFTTKARGKGTGLGLSTVFGIVSQAGGHVRVHSTPGHGATFEVRLPRSHGPLDAPSPAPPRQVEGGGETIILVEDDPGVRDVAFRVLSAAGYHVRLAAGGDDALATVAREPHIPLLVTDVVMPGMGGRELVTRARAVAPRLKVLFVSGYGAEVLDPDQPLLEKPFTPAQLLARVRALLDG